MSDRYNKECPTCGKKFHACGSCGLWCDWENVYCSTACWAGSTEAMEAQKIARRIALSFKGDEEGRELLFRVLEEWPPEKEKFLQDALKEQQKVELGCEAA